MKLCYSVWCLSFFLFFGCKSNSEQKTMKELSLSFENLSISIDSSALNSYYTFSYNDKLNLFVGYNDEKHSLDFFDLEKQAYVKQVILSKDGPDGVAKIRGIDLYSLDSIFVSDEAYFIKVLNQQGKVVSKHNVLSAARANPVVFGQPIVNQYVRLHYIPTRNSVILFATHDEKAVAEQPAFLEFNIKSNKLSALPVFFSDYYKSEKGSFGFMSYVNGTVVKDSLLIYNYLFENNLYSHNLASTKTENIQESESSFLKSKAEPLSKNVGKDMEKWEIHAIENPHYFQVLEDPKNKLFYRFAWQGVPYQTSGKTFNSFIDKDIILSVFDEKFNSIGEVKLKSNTYSVFSWFVSKQGIIISNTHPKNNDNKESILSFQILKVSPN